ncbi:MAG TPA: hypothetical protein VIX82_14850, partial [Solirubrobacteraceae bacterium]
LLAFMFVLHWYGPRADGARPVASLIGWQAFTVWRWLALLTILAGLCLLVFQATRHGPALPVSTSVVTVALALVSALWLAFRVLLDHPPRQQVGAILGLLAAFGILCGSFLSLRQEGIAPRDGPADVPTIRLDSATSGA